MKIILNDDRDLANIVTTINIVQDHESIAAEKEEDTEVSHLQKVRDTSVEAVQAIVDIKRVDR